MSPHPGDFEPGDPTASYVVRVLSLCVTSDKREAQILPGQAHLYGNEAVPGTLLKLAPSDSIRVLARIALPSPSGAELSGFVLVGHAMLDNETIRTVNGHSLSDLQEIGSASSPEYTLQSLFK
jgi:hypothetical protein